jgi:hypothetical protein
MDKYNINKCNKNTSLSKLSKYNEIQIQHDGQDIDNLCDNSSNNDQLQNMLKWKQLKEKIEFNQNIIEERNEEIQQIHKDILDISDIFKELDKLINEQNKPINQLENQIDETINKTKDGIIQIQKANEYHKSWFSKRNKIILMSIAGLSVNIPVTVLFGLKAGAISGISTFGLSAISLLFNK